MLNIFSLGYLPPWTEIQGATPAPSSNMLLHWETEPPAHTHTLQDPGPSPEYHNRSDTGPASPDPWPGHWSRNPGFRVPVCATDRPTLFLLGAVPDPEDLVDVLCRGHWQHVRFRTIRRKWRSYPHGSAFFSLPAPKWVPMPPFRLVRSDHQQMLMKQPGTPQTEAPIIALGGGVLEAR